MNKAQIYPSPKRTKKRNPRSTFGEKWRFVQYSVTRLSKSEILSNMDKNLAFLHKLSKQRALNDPTKQ